ncbi:MAG: hypothetical protein JOY71_28905 [Acetobacteraceae bacterium]|nr:hypothetical protein [Acetobacteraceae bacterium]
MKLPVSFGTKLVFRLLLPGAVLAAVMARIVHTVAISYGIKVPIAYSFLVEAALWGWLIVVLDMPIYILFEGRRFWPQWISSALRDLQRARLLKILRAMRHYEARMKLLPSYLVQHPCAPSTRVRSNWLMEVRCYLGGQRPVMDSRSLSRIRDWQVRNAKSEASRLYFEAVTKLKDFPLDRRTAMPTVSSPTRLGNLIAAYEQYPLLKYRLDPAFFWWRIWVTIDKDLREEIDNQQALVDGTLYMVAALFAAVVVLLAYAFIDWAWPNALMYHEYEGPGFNLLAAVLCLIAGYSLYSISLYAHSTFGELFKAVFDQNHSKIDLAEIVEFVAETAGDPSLENKTFLEKNWAAYRFLRWHRVKRPSDRWPRRVRT